MIFLDSYILLYTLAYVISRCIVNTMNLKSQNDPHFGTEGVYVTDLLVAFLLVIHDKMM